MYKDPGKRPLALSRNREEASVAEMDGAREAGVERKAGMVGRGTSLSVPSSSFPLPSC